MRRSQMMKKLLASAVAICGTTSLALAEPADSGPSAPVELTDVQMDRVTAGNAAPINPSWGELTRSAAGRELGEHASSEAVPRVGLANIVEQGSLKATIDLIVEVSSAP
jgi:hypothetical protein